MLRGKDYSNYGLNSFYDIETNMQKPNGGYGKAGIDNFNHSRTIDKNHTIVEQIDDIINNHSNTNTIKGVSYLNSVGDNVPTKQVMDIIDQYGPSSPEALQAVQNLVGLDITDKAFNSKTIPPNKVTSYSDRFNNYKRGEIKSLDLKVESYISPGCGAYIDTCGSFEDGLGELLVKRNCTQKIIDAYIDPNTSKLVLVTLYT